MGRRSGFTLIELAVVVAVGTTVLASLAPAVRHARSSARGAGSASNLMQIGQGAGMYAQDNAGRIFSFSWPGLVPRPGGGFTSAEYQLPDGSIASTSFDIDAAVAQETEIVQRRTGRIDGDFHFRFESLLPLPHRRRIGLVLLDYLDLAPGSSVFVDPSDSNQLHWSANPLDYGKNSTVPYAQDVATGYDPILPFAEEEVRQRWAFSSSYLTTASAWQADTPYAPGGYTTFAGSFVPAENTPHLFNIFNPGTGGTTPRRVALVPPRGWSEVRFPSAKVYFFEEHDREQAGDPYFAYDHAAPEKLMFDGSVNSWASGGAQPSWNPRNGKAEWRQTYVPLDKFPIPLGGLGDETLLSQRYRWTLGGLQGVDYLRPLMPGR